MEVDVRITYLLIYNACWPSLNISVAYSW